MISLNFIYWFNCEKLQVYVNIERHNIWTEKDGDFQEIKKILKQSI